MESDYIDSKDAQKKSEINRLRVELFKETFRQGDADAEKIKEINAHMNSLEPICFDDKKIAEVKEKFMTLVHDKHRKESYNAVLGTNGKRMRRKPSKTLRRVAVLIAVVVGMLIFTTGFAYAFGINIFEIITNFGQAGNRVDVTLNSAPIGAPEDIGDGSTQIIGNVSEKSYKSIREAISEMSVNPVLPKYIPEGLKVGLVNGAMLLADIQKLVVIYFDETALMKLRFTVKFGTSISQMAEVREFENDYTLIDNVSSDLFECVFFTDGINNVAIWAHGDAVYTISTILPVEEMIQIINSFE